jgi:hypothetical protein
LEKFPVAHDKAVEGRLENISLDDGTKKPGEDFEPFQYPEDVAANIKVVLDGLMYVYTCYRYSLVARRILLTISENTEPMFWVETKEHPKDLPQHLHRCLARKVMPHDDREYEWLRAFLAAVSWMEENLGESNENEVE